MIKMVNFAVTYEDKEIINALNYEFNEPSIICFTGVSGAGKTSILNNIGLISDNYNGDLYINNVKNINIHSQQACNIRKHDIAYLFQSLALIDNKTVLENLKIIKSASIEMIESYLEQFSLLHLKDKKVFTLSGGEQHRLAFIRILLQDTKVVILDEPGSNLDPDNKAFLLTEIKKLANEKIVIIVTHDPSIVKMADQVIVIEHK